MSAGLDDLDPENAREFWLDAFADGLGFGWLATRLPGNLSPSMIYALTAVSVPNIVTTAYHRINDISMIYADNPYFALQPILLVGAVYAARVLHREYDLVMEEMRIAERASDPDRLLDPTPKWLPWVLFGIAVVVQFTVPNGITDWDLMDYLFQYFVFPFVYTPIVVQFFTVYVSIEFIAPWRLSNSDVGIHFLDPQGVGGLRPLGELVKKAYYYVMIGLVGYAFLTYAPFINSWTTPLGANVLFTVIWVSTVATVAFAVLILHRFMHREKRAEIQRLEAELRDLIENPWDVKTYEIPADKEQEVTDLRDRITRVSDTREYPATFSIWSQLLLSIALPKALQLFLAGV
jgi:ABC-type multidrug transport system fused ATPase/permease subunit